MLVSEVLTATRPLLNDVGSSLYTDTQLLPFFKDAYKDLEDIMVEHGLQVTSEIDSVKTISALATTYGTLPSLMVYPITIFERIPGGTDDEWIEMIEKEFEPLITQAETLRFWVWRLNDIKFLGSTAAREVKLRYRKGFTAITITSDTVFMNNSKQ